MIPNRYEPLYTTWRDSPKVLGQRTPALILDLPDIGSTPWGEDLLALPIPPFSHPMKWATVFLIEASRTDLRSVVLLAESWVAEATDNDDRSPTERHEAGDPTVETYLSFEMWDHDGHVLISQREFLDDFGVIQHDAPTTAVISNATSNVAHLMDRAARLAVSGIDLDDFANRGGAL